MNPLLWIALLLLVGLVMMMLEVFVPSGGVLGFLSVVALIAAVVTAFVEQGATLGMVVLATTFVAVPVVLGLAFRWFPQTPLGRRVLPQPPRAEDVVPDADRRRRLRDLVGQHGSTSSDLLPWGGVEIDGRPFDAVSEGGPIARSAAVEVVGVQGAALVVRGCAGGPPAPADAGLSPTLEAFDYDDLPGNSTATHRLDSGPPPKQA
jgi:hypothetical protein